MNCFPIDLAILSGLLNVILGVLVWFQARQINWFKSSIDSITDSLKRSKTEERP